MREGEDGRWGKRGEAGGRKRWGKEANRREKDGGRRNCRMGCYTYLMEQDRSFFFGIVCMYISALGTYVYKHNKI